jgi:hypothetical protein
MKNCVDAGGAFKMPPSLAMLVEQRGKKEATGGVDLAAISTKHWASAITCHDLMPNVV